MPGTVVRPIQISIDTKTLSLHAKISVFSFILVHASVLIITLNDASWGSLGMDVWPEAAVN
jgi:hypothetical protein